MNTLRNEGLINAKRVRQVILQYNYNIMSKAKINKLVIELLMECHEREILQQEPCNPAQTKHYKASLQQGLLQLRPYTDKNGKIKQGFYITAKGKTAINTYLISSQ